jgi:adenosylcobinamide-GDP ribazoletransferase
VITALGFLTRLPVPRRAALASGELARAAVWFPAVGALVGLIAGGTRLLAEVALTPAAATVLALAAAVVVTGGLHEDGLGDTADGFGAHVAAERRLEIMRDPRMGTFGVLALVLVTLLAWTILAGLTAGDCVRALVTGHLLARWAMLAHSATSPPARSTGAGSLLSVGPLALAAATAFAAPGALLAAGPQAAGAAIATTLVVVAGMALLCRRAIGGTTGDTHGATGKLVEVAAFAAVAAVL